MGSLDDILRRLEGESDPELLRTAVRKIGQEVLLRQQDPFAGTYLWAANPIRFANSTVKPSNLSFDALAQLFIYGDGNDGDVTISGNTTLSRDMVYDNLTIDGGVVLSTAGYRVYVKDTLVNNGTIRHNGANTTAQTGGAGAAAGTMGDGSNGGNGAVATGTVAATAGAAKSNCLGTVGGAGGTNPPGGGGVNTGAAGGTITVTVANRHGLLLLGDSAEIRGGTGGGGGGCSTAGGDNGGGGGGGGGVIIIAAKRLDNFGTIEAKGGNGANGVTAVSGGSGGGGGGGGAVVLVYRKLIKGTITVTGGTAGAGTGNGVSGSNGTAGLELLIAQRA